ncbi:MAG TPA: CHAD domain-containing protein [Blastocatellia bacterium]|nr:CHAD domain-containing protein [Blastocatellia bacterium]
MTDGETQVVAATAMPAAYPAGEAEQPSLEGIIRNQIVSLRSHYLAVMETGDVEAIHRMRVTTRRLQASVDLLLSNGRQSQKDKTERYVRKLKKQLRKWRRKLSRVRNYDVFLILIEREINSRKSAHRENYELLKAILNQQREAHVEKVRRGLQGIEIEAIAKRLGIDIEAPPAEAGDAARGGPDGQETTLDQAALAAQAILSDKRRIELRAAQRLEQRIAEFHALAAQAHATTHPEDLHQLRIAAKRIRYLLEILTQLGVGKPDRPLVWLRSLQNRIGDWHDLEALEEEIIAILSQPGFLKEHLSESSHVLQAASHLQKKKTALVSRLFPIKVPKHLMTSSQRLIRTLRRSAAASTDHSTTVEHT